jgi:hypothetical protein
MATEMVCGVAQLAAILRFAERYPVFPCRRDSETVERNGRLVTLNAKSPLTTRGFFDATQDAAQIRAWWQKYPDALVGVPTGQKTDLVVVDYDHCKADLSARDWIGDHTDHLLTTRIHHTLNGGRHYLYKAPKAIKYRSSAGLTLGGHKRVGIDCRAEGGYIIWWPLHGGERSGVMVPLPAGLIDEYKIEERELAPLPTASPETWEQDKPLLMSALAHLDPSGYEIWQRTGAAIHLASGGSDDGFEVWHAWSSGGITGNTPRSYAGIDDCRYRWASFKHTGDKIATLGTIFHHAKDAGWTQPGIDFSGITADDVETDEQDKPPVVLRPLHEIVAEQREPEWLLDDVLEANVLAVLAGPRGTFKSFVGLDWSMRIAAAGIPVVILSGEGAGLDRRADAWIRTHGGGRTVEEFPVFALERAMNLNAELDLVQLKGAIERLGQVPGLVVVDTFSKFSAGLDENDNGEVSTYLARLSKAIRESYGSTVLLIAHSGHGDSARPRGASALMANPDAEYIINRPVPTGMHVGVSRERFKDCPALQPLGYEAQVIELGRVDKRGRPVTSLALMPSEVLVQTQKKAVGANQERALVALREYHRQNPEARFITSIDLSGLLGAQGINRKRRPEVLNWLCNASILTASIGGHTLDPSYL